MEGIHFINPKTSRPAKDLRVIKNFYTKKWIKINTRPMKWHRTLWRSNQRIFQLLFWVLEKEIKFLISVIIPILLPHPYHSSSLQHLFTLILNSQIITINYMLTYIALSTSNSLKISIILVTKTIYHSHW